MSSHLSRLAARPLPLDLDRRRLGRRRRPAKPLGAPGGRGRSPGSTTPIQGLVPAMSGSLRRPAGGDAGHLPHDARAAGAQPGGHATAAVSGTGVARWELYVRDVSTGRSTAAVVSQPSGWNGAIIDGLAPEPGDRVIVKRSFSGFFGTDLDDVLRDAGITTLLFTGCTTSICVESTLRDAVFRGYDCILVEDCVAEPVGGTLDRTNHDATVHLVEIVLGWVSDSASIVESLDTAELSENQLL